MSGRGGGGGRDRFRRDYPSRFEDKMSSHSGSGRNLISNSNNNSNNSGHLPSRHLWVGNLSHSILEHELTNHFLQFGVLESVAFQPGRSYAFLNFKRDDDAFAAINALQGFSVAGNPLRIEFTKAMGSLDGRAVIEFEDESLVSPAAASISTNKNSFREITHISAATSAKSYKQHMRNSVIDSIKIVIFSAKINILMPLGPLAILVDKMSGSHGWVFFLSLLGIIPLAEHLGYATEQLACFTGPIVGGLLNATFGNITELIISIYALKSGMIRVVQQSLLGSILSNMLLVLGCAFFSGGIVFYEKEQVFDMATASVNSGLLLMAVMGLLFPAVLHSTHTELHFGKSELALSRFSSCIMLVAYASYLAYQLKRQKNQYIPVDGGETQTEEGSDDEEAPEISMWESIIWLSILTAWVSFLSEYLVNVIEGASASLKIPVAFISVILLPIVGNAAEHAGAVMFAMKDKLDISLGVAIGSSTQIAMFGIPFCVVAGWVMGRPMDLNFQLFETATLFITVLVVAFMVQDGTSNYSKGLMLVLCYLIVAASFFVHIDPSSIADKPPKPSH